MDKQTNLKTEIVEGLKEILKKSLPYCRESPYREEFIDINRLAHEALIRLNRLGVEELK